MTTSYKPTTTEQLSLAFELYNRIPKGRKVTAKQLQTELAIAGIERDVRTIQRNLDVVVQYLGVDKDARNKPYGYSRKIGEQVILGPRELTLLQLAKSALVQQLPSSLEHAIESAFGFVLDQPRSYTGTKPPKGGQTKVKATTESTTKPEYITALFEPIAVALTHQKQISFALQDGESLEQVSPVGLITAYNEFYLVYQNTFNEYDDLPIKDITHLKVLTFHFDYPSDFKLSEYQLKSKAVNGSFANTANTLNIRQ